MQSKATAQWEGDLMSGKGKTNAGSGTFRDLNLSWKARTEGAASNTTPEELLAAAHASCFSMALSHALAQGGHAPKRLDTTCTVEFAFGSNESASPLAISSRAMQLRGCPPMFAKNPPTTSLPSAWNAIAVGNASTSSLGLKLASRLPSGLRRAMRFRLMPFTVMNVPPIMILASG